MNSDNPYSAPQSFHTPLTASGISQGIWRDGKKLVVHRDAVLPPICVKTNEPSVRKIKRKYYWRHPAVLSLVLLNVLIYIIVAMAIRKRHDLEVPVSEETADNRRNWMAIGWIISLGAIGLCIASIAWMLEPANNSLAGYGVGGLILSGITLIVGAFFGARAAGILYPKKMTGSATWFNGAHWEYLERFPEVPPNV